MFKIKSKDEKFLLENVPNIKPIIESGNKRDIQDAFYDWMDVNCFDKESDGFFNELGLQAQEIWDSIRNTD